MVAFTRPDLHMAIVKSEKYKVTHQFPPPSVLERGVSMPALEEGVHIQVIVAVPLGLLFRRRRTGHLASNHAEGVAVKVSIDVLNFKT